ncbi:MAG: excinuclease ABC subunit UvrC [Eubacteriales bacterium]|nr:excinuclease ABC subunit UvrC [Eubacteriales bacterium]
MKKFNLEAELKLLPEKPGVYIMHSADDTVIYVGKAKILKNRVRQYFQSSKNHTPKVRAMVSNISYFEYIITDSETEALVLECNLIKKYRPKYNILLKDDKQYPYIKVTINEKYPRIFMTRQLKNDGAKYFGPYAGGGTVKVVLELVGKIFKPPKCHRKFPDDIGKGRPCLNYHIKACFAPCTGKVSEEEYRRIFYSICRFLDGDHKSLVSELEQEMKRASQNMEFERAAEIRDELLAINRLDEKQKIVNSDNMNDMDIVAAATTGDNAFCEIFFVRMGKVVGRENFRLVGASDRTPEEIISDFLKQFYRDAQFVPTEILTDTEASDADVIAQWLSERKGKKVTIHSPKRGEKRKIADMVRKNADTACVNYLAAKQKNKIQNSVINELAAAVGLETPPEYIEAYDISNISGSDNVGSMVVFKNGKPARSRYRSFNIKSFEGANDYKAMQEVLYRRLKRAYDEEDEIAKGTLTRENAKFLPLPDLMLIDGGEGHLAAAQEMLQMMSVDIPAFGMVKDDKHRTRALASEQGEIALSKTGSVFKLITAIQDEAHRSAITHHRGKRSRQLTKSELDEINGVGEKKKAKLLKHFKSINAIKAASVEELVAAGIDRKTAENIAAHFLR